MIKNKNLVEFAKVGMFRPTYVQGSGRYISNYTCSGWEDGYKGEIKALTDIGLKLNKHYIVGNDAPRGGACGRFVKLTSAGKRLKVIKELANVPTSI